MTSQIRTQTDFFSNTHYNSDIPFPTSNINHYQFDEHHVNTAKFGKANASDLESCSLEDELFESGSNTEFFPSADNHSELLYKSFNHSNPQTGRKPDVYLQNTVDSQVANQASLKRKSNICLSRENIMRHWTSGDDDELMNLADQYKNDWKKIAKRIISNRKKKVTPNFLKNRYKEIAGDHIKKGVKFTHEEDLLIAKLFEIHGTSWTSISYHFKDRTPVMIKNRYYSHIRRKGLLSDLVSEAHGKVKTDDYDNSDSFIGSPSSFQNSSTQANQGENHENSVIHHNDALEMDDNVYNKSSFMIGDQVFTVCNRYSYLIDEGLCNLHNNNHEDLLNVRVTDFRHMDNFYQF